MRVLLQSLMLTTALTAATATAAAKPVYRPITFDVSPRGATVELGRRDWKAPCTLWLRDGATYRLRISADGHEPKVETVRVSGKAKVRVELPPIGGTKALLTLVPAGDEAVGAAVSLNGKSVGALPLAEQQLDPGRVLVEVSKAGFAAWHSWVVLTQGERKQVSVTLEPEQAEGSLFVTANVEGAEVLLEGKKVGATPLHLKGVARGEHALQVRAEKYDPDVRLITIDPAKTTRVVVELRASAGAAGGTLQVMTDPPNVDVLVDGKFRAKAPARITDVEVGTHVVEVKWPGYRTIERQVAVRAGQLSSLKLTLTKDTLALEGAVQEGDGGNLLVVSSVRGADVYLDGKPAGRAPYVKANLAPRHYEVLVRAPGYAPVVERVQIETGRTARVVAMLEPGAPLAGPAVAGPGVAPPDVATTSAAQERAELNYAVAGLSSFGAQLVPRWRLTGDVALGYPHLLEGRLTTGVFSWGHIGLDAGVELRTYGVVTEGGVTTKLRLFQRDPFALALHLGIGGGGGAKSRATFYTNIGALGSIIFKRLITVTAGVTANIYSDRHCPSSIDFDELGVCSAPPAGLTETDMRERFDNVRLMLSASVEFPLTDHLGLFARVNGVPFQDERLAYTDAFASYFPESDPRFYGRAGLSLKF